MEGKTSLKRVLGLRDLLVFAIMTMVPIAPMGVYGIVASVSHGYVPLTYVVAAAAMFFTAWSYGQFAYRIPEAGSAYAYVRETLGHYVGFVTGWVILLDYILVPSLVILVAALWLEAVSGIPMILWALAFIAFATVANILGVEMTMKASVALFIFEAGVLAAFVAAAIHKILVDPNLSFTLTPFYDPKTFSLNYVVAGASIAVLSFLGFDIMTTLAEETKEARKVVSKAVVLVVPIITTFFVVQTYLAAVVHPSYVFKDTDVAFYYIANEVGGRWLQLLTMAGTVLAAGIGDTLAAQAGISRVLFSMGRQGQLPKVFSKLHPKYRTPYVSTLVVAAITAPIVYLLTLRDLSSIVNFGALTAFLLMQFSLAYRFIRMERRPLLAIMPAIGFMITGSVWYGLDIDAKELGFAWIVAGIAYLAYMTKGFKVRSRIVLPDERA